jgi:hypothetical protein
VLDSSVLRRNPAHGHLWKRRRVVLCQVRTKRNLRARLTSMFQKQTVLGFSNLYQFLQRDELPSWYCRVRIVHLTLFAVFKAILRACFRNACCRCVTTVYCSTVEVILKFLSDNSFIETGTTPTLQITTSPTCSCSDPRTVVL